MKKVVIALVALEFVACSLPGICQELEEDKIKRVSEKFSADYMKADFSAMTDAYTDDAIVMSPGREIVTGKKNINEFWRSLPSRKMLLHKSEPEKIIIHGDEAHDYGYFYTQIEENGNAGPVNSSKYYIIWARNKNGEWKMKMDMWNSRSREWNAKTSNDQSK